MEETPRSNSPILSDALAEFERRDAEHDAGRSRKTRQTEAFLEPQRAHERGKQYRGLAQRCDGRNGSARHRPQYDTVGGEAACAADESAVGTRAHVLDRRLPAS